MFHVEHLTPLLFIAVDVTVSINKIATSIRTKTDHL